LVLATTSSCNSELVEATIIEGLGLGVVRGKGELLSKVTSIVALGKGV
jgi:hypothetical protein